VVFSGQQFELSAAAFSYMVDSGFEILAEIEFMPFTYFVFRSRQVAMQCLVSDDTA
jgi:hypothetical protein